MGSESDFSVINTVFSLIATMISIIALYFNIKPDYFDADIRGGIVAPEKIRVKEAVKASDGSILFRMIVNETFENYGFRDGYIEKITVTAKNLRSEQILIHTIFPDRVTLHRKKKTKVDFDLRFSLLKTFRPSKSDSLEIRLEYYDNNGRLVKLKDSSGPAWTDLKLQF